MDKLSMITESEAYRKILEQYSGKGMWSKTARSLLKKKLFGGYRIEAFDIQWGETLQKWYHEFRVFERDERPLFFEGMTQETTREGFIGLVEKMHAMGYLQRNEMQQLVRVFSGESGFIKPANVRAQLLLLKAFFEISMERSEKQGYFRKTYLKDYILPH